MVSCVFNNLVVVNFLIFDFRIEECKLMKFDDLEVFFAIEVRKMKKFFKRRILFFILSFRKKSIKLFREDSV